MAVPIIRIRKYYMDRIDPEDVTMVEMVDRYLDLLNVFRESQKSVAKVGVQVVVENGSQSFIKSNPLINDMKNTNAQLMSLKKDIDKHIETYQKSRPELSKRKEGLI